MAAAAAAREALRCAFGDSDSESGDDGCGPPSPAAAARAPAAAAPGSPPAAGTASAGVPVGEPLPLDAPSPRASQVVEYHPVIRGLSIVRGFLSPQAQAALLAAVRAEGWAPAAAGAAAGAPPPRPPCASQSPPARPRADQAMHFGRRNFPPFVAQLADAIAAAASALGLFPEALLASRGGLGREAPLFNQMICNAYSAGARLAPHVDLAAFADGIVSVSLLGEADMDFGLAGGAMDAEANCGAERNADRVEPGGAEPDGAGWASEAGAAAAPGVVPAMAGEAGGCSSRTRKRKVPPELGGGRDSGDARSVPRPARDSDGRGTQLGSPTPSPMLPPPPQVVLLRPGDLLCMCGPARYLWTHGIAAHAAPRVSLTLRAMEADIHELTHPAEEEAEGCM